MKTSRTIVLGALVIVFSLIVVPIIVVAYDRGVFRIGETLNTPTPHPTMAPATSSPAPTPTNNPSTNNAYDAKITEFKSLGGWFCPGGVEMDIVFNVTIQNIGVQNITELNLLIKRTLVSNDDHSIVQTLNVPSGGTVHTTGYIAMGIDQYTREFRGSTYTASISLNGVILDERTIEITGSQF